ncbi:family 16 glycoside hydrolase [Melampsora americana]|nr:family 16 glycoside hydrolase [Melampsora americana]
MTPGGGVELILQPPAGPVTTSKDGSTNDKLGDGATINSTFALLYGKVTFTLQASSVPGSVTAAVLIGTKTDDEIDVEILGGDPTHWQTNVFRSAPGETEPLYGVFGGVEGYSGNGRVDQVHKYVVDWSPTRIEWSVDGQVMRTLTPSGTLHGGQQHYPSAASRIQIGIWDASNPSGTSEWAKGPIPW